MRKKFIFAIIISVSFTILGGCSSNKIVSNTLSLVSEQARKPSEEGFSFEYQMPEDWTPTVYSEDNSKKISEILIPLDRSDKEMTPNQYYTEYEGNFIYGEAVDLSFWNVNPDVPKELYTIPVNLWAATNDIKLVSGKDFAALNADRIPYYVQTADRIRRLYSSWTMDNFDQMQEDLLYYETPGRKVEDTFTYAYGTTVRGFKMSRHEAAFLTDNSLCYLATDGTIRVRGLLVFCMETETFIKYGKMISEVALEIVPEGRKLESNNWKFGDLTLAYFKDLQRSESLTEEEYQTFLKQKSMTIDIPDLPEWAGIYGEKE